MVCHFILLVVVALFAGQYDPTAKESDQDRKLDQKMSFEFEFRGTLGKFLGDLAVKRDLTFLVELPAFETMGYKDVLGTDMVVPPRKSTTLREYLAGVLRTVNAQCGAGKGYIETTPIPAKADKEAGEAISSPSLNQILQPDACRPFERRVRHFRRFR
jgi:hypothetical protein